jgi:hypothetical protein
MPSNNYIYKMSNAGGMSTVTRYTDMLAGNAVWNPWEPAGAYESIAVATAPSGGVASITFGSIPQTYSHLQIRGFVRTTAVQSLFGLRLRVGNNTLDTSGNYSTHQMYGDGSTVATAANFSANETYMGTGPAANNLADTFGVAIIDILDYSNTTTNKTIRSLNGVDMNGSGYVGLNSAAWLNTSAINILSLYPSAGSFAQYSQIALYGIKG